MRYKARLVAKGYNQQFGVDYHETYAPVVKLQSLRVILALASTLKLKVHQIDIETAFLNGDLSDEVCAESPPGSNVSKDYICRLRKTLYDQSSNLMNGIESWSSSLLTLGSNSSTQTCAFSLITKPF